MSPYRRECLSQRSPERNESRKWNVGGYGKARNSGDSPRFGGIAFFPYYSPSTFSFFGCLQALNVRFSEVRWPGRADLAVSIGRG